MCTLVMCVLYTTYIKTCFWCRASQHAKGKLRINVTRFSCVLCYYLTLESVKLVIIQTLLGRVIVYPNVVSEL